MRLYLPQNELFYINVSHCIIRQDYSLNMDETGLFFRQLPDKSLSTSDHTKGTKKSKGRLTVVLTCNADGSDKLRPLVIGKSKKPRCFNNFNHKLYVDYAFNTKAWMTSSVFTEWLTSFNRKMTVQDRHVLLILDNAPSHIMPGHLSNVKLHFLPPTTTSHLQPLDAGIIKSFKSNFRKQQLRLVIDQLDKGRSYKVSVSDAIRFTKHAWDAASATTINNCWKHTGLTPRTMSDATLQLNEDPDDDIPLTELVQRSVTALQIDEHCVMSAEEFLGADLHAEVCSDMSDTDILGSEGHSFF